MAGEAIELPLWRIKLHRPYTAPDFVPRPRLVELLERHRQRPLTLAVPPAGFGRGAHGTLRNDDRAERGAGNRRRRPNRRGVAETAVAEEAAETAVELAEESVAEALRETDDDTEGWKAVATGD